MDTATLRMTTRPSSALIPSRTMAGCEWIKTVIGRLDDGQDARLCPQLASCTKVKVWLRTHPRFERAAIDHDQILPVLDAVCLKPRKARKRSKSQVKPDTQTLVWLARGDSRAGRLVLSGSDGRKVLSEFSASSHALRSGSEKVGGLFQC